MTHDPASPKPYIVPVFIPHKGCPHRCVFCNQRTITGLPDNNEDLDAIRYGIGDFLGYRRDGRGRTQISFYGGTFLGLEPERICRLLGLAQDFVDHHGVHGLRFSTRPDTVTQETLALIEPYSVQTVELGAQSMDNRVLELSGRGHSAEDTVRAMDLLKQSGYETGIQMMVGLPGDTPETAWETACAIASLEPDFVRIYPTVVLKDSGLARLFSQGAYEPLDLGESVSLVKRLFGLFRDKGITVIRMGLQPSDGLDVGGQILAGPYHPSFGHLVYSERFLDMARELLERHGPGKSASVVLTVHPKNISVARGLKNSNIQALKSEFGLSVIRVKEDDALDAHTINLSYI